MKTGRERKMETMDAEKKHRNVKIVIFPFMAHGHMIPALDMAKMLASHGSNITIITTPFNLPFVSTSLRHVQFDIEIETIEFPCAQVGLPPGFENADSLTHSYTPELANKFFKATWMLQDQVEKLLESIKPDCLVSDVLFPWTTKLAAKFYLPRLIFHGSSFFAMCVELCVKMYQPHKKVSSDSEPFKLPALPGPEIEFTRTQIMDSIADENDEFAKIMKETIKAGPDSFGVVTNSFYELEKPYVDFYRKSIGGRAWNIGPVSLCNKRTEEKCQRGKESSVDHHDFIKWLNSKKPNSVVYVCFGSVSNFTEDQLKEIAAGLENSGQDFIWVVRKDGDSWLPEGFEERMRDKGMIIRGWAPQMVILEHQATGGFVTHCGWNSVLEAVTAGVPMATWPTAFDQFYNEKLVTQVLGIGVTVGVEKTAEVVGDFVTREKVTKAVREVMVGDSSEEMRIKARALGVMARGAVEKGGSSYSDLDALLNDLLECIAERDAYFAAS